MRKLTIKKRYIILAFLLFIVVGSIVAFELLFGAQVRAAMSIEKITDDFYSMEYKGNYGFNVFLKQGGADSDKELLEYITEELYHGIYDVDMENFNFGCSTLSVMNEEGEALLGRNFDYPDCKSMVVTTRPKNGYDSISTCDLKFLGIGSRWDETKLLDKLIAVASVYLPVDGMNEKGVCIAVLTISDGSTTNQNTDKPDITTTTAIRLVLDYAANVDEAIALLEQYDMHASLNKQFKFTISDASGKTVNVEYINNEMQVTEAKYASNFYQTPGDYYGIGISQPDGRYEVLRKAYEECGGVMDNDKLMKTMEMASQKYFHHNHTQWTAVFHTKELKAEYCHHENFEVKYEFSLK